MLALLYLSCALLDGYVTYRILSAYGVGLEFNPLVRLLSPRVGLINSLLLSVILPRLISLGILLWWGNVAVFSFVTGACVMYGIQQVRALQVASTLKARVKRS